MRLEQQPGVFYHQSGSSPRLRLFPGFRRECGCGKFTVPASINSHGGARSCHRLGLRVTHTMSAGFRLILTHIHLCLQNFGSSLKHRFDSQRSWVHEPAGLPQTGYLYAIIIVVLRRRRRWRLHLHAITVGWFPLPLGILLSSTKPTLGLWLLTADGRGEKGNTFNLTSGVEKKKRKTIRKLLRCKDVEGASVCGFPGAVAIFDLSI